MFINLWIARGAPAENPRSTSTQDGPGREKTSTGAAIDVLRSGPAPVEEQHDDGDVVVEVPPVALLDSPDLLVPDLLLPRCLQLRSRRHQPSSSTPTRLKISGAALQQLPAARGT
ncbi:hypothetical protein SETIT_8G167000v2 [Setaria italica]|uniref:Uncharacterized protein n=1 Tax=Setaria italica TaxID=4555 RepID=A0A368S8S0_SETIT|nr:hypothetical protein SETIT_8G167000v2 [Setaria italica]